MKLINKRIRKDYMQFVFDMENGHEFPCAEFVYRYGNHRIAVSLRECKFEQNSEVNMVITTNDFRPHTWVINDDVVRLSKKAMKENVINVDAGLVMALARNTDLNLKVNEAIQMVDELRGQYGLVEKKIEVKYVV